VLQDRRQIYHDTQTSSDSNPRSDVLGTESIVFPCLSSSAMEVNVACVAEMAKEVVNNDPFSKLLLSSLKVTKFVRNLQQTVDI
jgi:hypothetical protein